MYRTQGQNKQLHDLIGQLGIDSEEKKKLVQKYTGGRETSSAKMRVIECQALINELKVFGGQDRKRANDPSDKMRKKILSICREMGGEWYVNGQYNWNKINGWLSKYGYLHDKHSNLNDYSAAELPKLVTQFDNLLKSHYARR